MDDASKLKTEIHELIRTYPEMTLFTTVAILEFVKFELMNAARDDDRQDGENLFS